MQSLQCDASSSFLKKETGTCKRYKLKTYSRETFSSVLPVLVHVLILCLRALGAGKFYYYMLVLYTSRVASGYFIILLLSYKNT